MLHVLVQAADKAAKKAGIGPSGFSPRKLIADAERRSGRALRERTIEAPLTKLLRAYATEADLSLFGSAAAKWDAQRCLANLLRLEHEEERHPAVLWEPIEKPIFITGLPRSGTTFLHTLAALDPANRSPACWQTIYPYPEEADRKRDRRARRVGGQLRIFERLTPGIGQLHPLSAEAPQECTEITSHVFQSMRFDTTHHVPSYQNWLEAQGHTGAYRFHKRFLQHLQFQSGKGRWVLKCPDHVFAFDAIDAVYPDARFVFVHRNPLAVLPSVAKLTALLRRPFTRALNPAAIGRQVTDRWTHGARLIIERCKRSRREDRIFHVHYDELTAKPLETVAALYDRFGLDRSASAYRNMADFIQRTPRGGYGSNRYSFEEFGLTPEDLHQRFAEYLSYFDISRRKTSDRKDQALEVA